MPSLSISSNDPKTRKHAEHIRISNFLKKIVNLSTSFEEDNEGTKDCDVPVLHTHLIKELREDKDGNVHLIGTFIQRNFGLKKEDDDSHFGYRFNEVDESIYNGVKHRKTVGETIGGHATSKSTFSCTIPMRLEKHLAMFPFTVVRASVDIELTTRKDKMKKNLSLVPNFLIHPEQPHNNVCLQGNDNVFGRLSCGKKLSEESTASTSCTQPVYGLDREETHLADKLDQMSSYYLATPFPKVEYLLKKGSCSKYRVSFLLVEESMVKVVKVLLPMLLVATINTINVLLEVLVKNDSDDNNVSDDNNGIDVAGSDRYLQISAALALTAVFILPHMARHWNTQSFFTFNECYIFIIFIALSLSSIPPRMVGSDTFAYSGMVLFWSSFLIPLCNMVSFCRRRQAIINERRTKIKEHGKNHKLQGFEIHPFLKKNEQGDWAKSCKKKSPEERKEMSNLYFVPDFFENQNDIEGEEIKPRQAFRYNSFHCESCKKLKVIFM